MTVSEKRVVITGMGVVAPNGHGKEEFSSSLRNGKSGIRFIEKLQELKFSCQVGGVPQGINEKLDQYFQEDELIAMNEAMIYAGIASLDAWKDAGLTVTDSDSDKVNEDTGAIIGTGIGGISTLANEVVPKVAQGKVKRLGSTVVERIMCSAVSAKVGGLLALGNQVTTNSSACSTGTEAIIMGYQRIKAGLANRMVVGGAEGSDPHTWSGFDSMKVLCKKFNDKPEAASRPMSASAAGFIPGSGSGILIIEDLATAKARGAKIYAEIIGSSINSGGMRKGGSITAPSPSGVKRCVREAVLEAGIQSSEIDYINGHLTATMADKKEVGNWANGLELQPEELPKINSTKSMIGHALGASGSLEMVATLLQMEGGFVHGSLNCEDLHPDLHEFKNSIVQKSVDTDIKVAAKASFGFGDVNSCIILRKWS